MTPKEALKRIEAMPEKDFQEFYKKLPARVKVLIGSGLVEWRRALPQWYIKQYGKTNTKGK